MKARKTKKNYVVAKTPSEIAAAGGKVTFKLAG